MRSLVFTLISLMIMTDSLAQKALSFLALGDSYTIGEAVLEQERWPVQFVGMMKEMGVHFDMPQIIAKTGWTSSELQDAIQKSNPQGPFDLVSLLIGVNNQYRGNSAEEYAQEFRALLLQAIAFAGNQANHVIVVSIPDWGATPFGQHRDRSKITQEIDLFNSLNQKISIELGVHYVDITPGSRAVLNDVSFVADDGLHPSGKEYRHWAEKVVQELKSVY